MPAQGAAKVVDGKPGEVAKSRVLPTDTSTFQFVLVREGATLKAWERFYRHPRFNEYNIQYSLGLPDQELTQRTKGTTLELVRQRRITFIWLVTALVFIGLIWLAIRTDIIKDQSTHEKRPYSLARTQIAWWTLVVLAAFLHLYVYTNEMPTLTDATLVLLGISAGTFAGARLVDQSQAEAQRHQSTVGSRGFFYDLMSDGSDRYNSGRNGISVHRFQLLIWTLVLTILFLRYTLRNLDMPKFDDNLLLLMGISNGTYLLLKIPENAQPATEVPAAPLHAQQPTANMNAAGAGATTISQRPAEDDNGPTADLPANVDLDPNAASNPNNGVG
ncbi:hypothetical protein SAMN02745146_2950 [Hymenobacter daecheongensis DSM 21074]|uniref:Uncharacterized protein n=2 Tax=Hymenobacter daecheongensis TaxID=496053 RepID=A0A1M6IRV9_9BACT|nr:hypothetical protein SAMN02745146_2950 [Hymenobacter daecheongensis DSM 21074]